MRQYPILGYSKFGFLWSAGPLALGAGLGFNPLRTLPGPARGAHPSAQGCWRHSGGTRRTHRSAPNVCVEVRKRRATARRGRIYRDCAGDWRGAVRDDAAGGVGGFLSWPIPTLGMSTPRTRRSVSDPESTNISFRGRRPNKIHAGLGPGRCSPYPLVESAP